jgi:hypothetical protein
VTGKAAGAAAVLLPLAQQASLESDRALHQHMSGKTCSRAWVMQKCSTAATSSSVDSLHHLLGAETQQMSCSKTCRTDCVMMQKCNNAAISSTADLLHHLTAFGILHC